MSTAFGFESFEGALEPTTPPPGRAGISPPPPAPPTGRGLTRREVRIKVLELAVRTVEHGPYREGEAARIVALATGYLDFVEGTP